MWGGVEGRERFQLPLESRQTIGITGQRLGQDLERDLSIELGVARAIDLAHTPGPERAENLVRADTRSG